MNESTEVKPVKPKNLANKALVTLDPDQYVAAVFEPYNTRLALAVAKIVDVEYDITTTTGMNTAKECRSLFKTIRIDADKERSARKAPIIAIGKLLETKNTEIENSVKPYEEKFDVEIKAEEARKELEKAEKIRVENERQERLKTKIAYIKDAPLRAIDLNATATQALIDELSILVPTSADYEERTVEAEVALEGALTQLKSLHAGKIAVEDQQARDEAQRAEDQKREQEQNRINDIRARIQGIKNAVIEGSECESSVSLQSIIDRVIALNTSTFAEFSEEADTTKASTLASLGRQLKFVKMEEQQADQALLQVTETAAPIEIVQPHPVHPDLLSATAPAEVQPGLQDHVATASTASESVETAPVLNVASSSGVKTAASSPSSVRTVEVMYFTGRMPTTEELAQGVAKIFATSEGQAAKWLQEAFGMKQAA